MKINLKLFVYFLALIITCVLFSFSTKAKAADEHLVVNEVYSAPLSGEKEWVELYNPTALNIDLSDYSIKDGSSSAKKLSGTIIAGSFFVFEVASGWLNNSGEKLELIYDPSSENIDNLAYGDWNDNQENQPGAPTNGKSLSRIPNASDTNDDLLDFRLLTPSKGEENILPTYSASIIINEIAPAPANGSAFEFIELYNSGSDEVDLSAWQIDDGENSGSSPFTIPDGVKISALGYLVFYNSETAISLNDSGDEARLLDPNGDEKSAIIYNPAKRGQSYSKFSTWNWSTTLTPSSLNILTIEVEEEPPEVSVLVTDISGAKEQADGILIEVTGTVTVAPGKLSSQYFYIDDGRAGVQVYSYSRLFPQLVAGDEIKVKGELATTSGERRIKIASNADIILLTSHPPPESIETTISELGETFEGRYVSVVGTVTKTSGSTFYIRGSGEVQILIREGTGIKKPRMRVGDKVQIAGIFSQNGDTSRILPTAQGDVKIIGSGKLANTGTNQFFCLVLSLIITIIYGTLLKKSRDYS